MLPLPKLSDFLIVVQFLTQKGQESVCFRYNRLEETVQVWAAERENDSPKGPTADLDRDQQKCETLVLLNFSSHCS